jgi:hypothetical protein
MSFVLWPSAVALCFATENIIQHSKCLFLRFIPGEWFTSDIWGDFIQHYQTGYSDCMRELIRYMTEVEHLNTADSRCVRILSYLQTRFRPDNSINSGTVYRDSLSRSSANAEQRHPTTSSNSRGHHRFSPYSLPGGSHTPRTEGGMFTEKQTGPHTMITPVSSSSPIVSLVNLHRTSPAIRTQAHAGLYGLVNGNIDRLISVGSSGPSTIQSESRISAFTRQIQKWWPTLPLIINTIKWTSIVMINAERREVDNLFYYS